MLTNERECPAHGQTMHDGGARLYCSIEGCGEAPVGPGTHRPLVFFWDRPEDLRWLGALMEAAADDGGLPLSNTDNAEVRHAADLLGRAAARLERAAAKAAG